MHGSSVPLYDRFSRIRHAPAEAGRFPQPSYRRSKRKEEFAKLRKDISGSDDRINPQHRSNLRAVSAEESLIAYLVNNPDKQGYIESRIKADDFVTDFNRKLYLYFLERIKSKKDPMTAISADFTADETSQIYRIVNSYSNIRSTPQALDEYINIILEEGTRMTANDIANASTDDLSEYLRKLAEQKK